MGLYKATGDATMSGGQGGNGTGGTVGGTPGQDDPTLSGPGGAGGAGTQSGAGGGGGGSGGAGGAGGAGAGGAAGGGTTPSPQILAAVNGTQGTSAAAGSNGGGGGGGGAPSDLFNYNGNGTIGNNDFSNVVGVGGIGGAGDGTGSGGGGGGGGSLVRFAAGTSNSTSNGTIITGGAGGAGGAAGGGVGSFGGNGGDGGAALYFGDNSSYTIVNGATTTGGAGGAGGSGGLNGTAGIQGVGGAGVVASNSIISVNAGGTLAGGAGSTQGNAATFTSGANTLNLGGAISGNVAIQTGTLQINAATGGSTLANTLTGAGGVIQNSADTLTRTGTNTFTGATTISQGTLALSGSGSIANSSGVANAGTFDISGTTAGASVSTLSGAGGTTLGAQALTVTNGSTSYSGTIAGTGGVAVTGGTQTLTGANTYSGGTTIGATGSATSSTLQLGAATSAGTGPITFGSMSGTATARLGLNVAAQPASGGTFGNTIANFGSSNEIALAGLTNSSVSYNSANTSITITGTRVGGGQVSENFVLSAPRTTSFSATTDGQGNTIVRGAAATNPTNPTNPPTNPTNPTNPTQPANNAPCYCTGTRILTDHGEVAVEALAIGDVLVTASGECRPIRWIGTRRYIGRFANTNPAVLPVCVKAGALADSIPSRDLWVSPDHALYLDGVLIPAEHLVNGATIVKADRVDSVTYWHIELDSHDVLVADGAPAESFVDDGGRAIFHNAASYRALYPHQPAWPVAAAYCAERVRDGYALEAVRRRLARRAGLPVAPARVFGELLGHLDLCDGLRVSGWAQDLAHPDGPVCLDIVVDGAVVAMACAETYRADLETVGIGDGCHAFDLELPEPLALEAAHTVEVRRSADGAVVGMLRVEAAIAVAA